MLKNSRSFEQKTDAVANCVCDEPPSGFHYKYQNTSDHMIPIQNTNNVENSNNINSLLKPETMTESWSWNWENEFVPDTQLCPPPASYSLPSSKFSDVETSLMDQSFISESCNISQECVKLGYIPEEDKVTNLASDFQGVANSFTFNENKPYEISSNIAASMPVEYNAHEYSYDNQDDNCTNKLFAFPNTSNASHKSLNYTDSVQEHNLSGKNEKVLLIDQQQSQLPLNKLSYSEIDESDQVQYNYKQTRENSEPISIAALDNNHNASRSNLSHHEIKPENIPLVREGVIGSGTISHPQIAPQVHADLLLPKPFLPDSAHFQNFNNYANHEYQNSNYYYKEYDHYVANPKVDYSTVPRLSKKNISGDWNFKQHKLSQEGSKDQNDYNSNFPHRDMKPMKKHNSSFHDTRYSSFEEDPYHRPVATPFNRSMRYPVRTPFYESGFYDRQHSIRAYESYQQYYWNYYMQMAYLQQLHRLPLHGHPYQPAWNKNVVPSYDGRSISRSRHSSVDDLQSESNHRNKQIINTNDRHHERSLHEFNHSLKLDTDSPQRSLPDHWINNEFYNSSVTSKVTQSDLTGQTRLTPTKFTFPHICARFAGFESLLLVMPHDPKDGSCAQIQLLDLQTLLSQLPLAQELRPFPGPLIKGVAHKQSVIQFCIEKKRQLKNRSDLLSIHSAELLWDYLLLLLRQNGNVSGTDVAEILLQNQEIDVSLGMQFSNSSANNTSALKTFRELLLFGHFQNALEYAMQNHFWSHALFLASTINQETYINVFARFANTVPTNDPIYTLYQMLTGHEPTAMMSKWNNWQSHVAMILANASYQSELSNHSLVTVADNLSSQGCIHAAHLCYLLANIHLSPYQQKSAKIVLLGSSQDSSFTEFVNCESIQATEILEYAYSLSGTFSFYQSFLPFKFIYVTWLLDHGLFKQAGQYLEIICRALIDQSVTKISSSLRELVYSLTCIWAVYLAVDESHLQWLSDLQKFIQINNSQQIQKASLESINSKQQKEYQSDPCVEYEASHLIELSNQTESSHDDSMIPQYASWMHPSSDSFVPLSGPISEINKQFVNEMQPSNDLSVIGNQENDSNGEHKHRLIHQTSNSSLIPEISSGPSSVNSDNFNNNKVVDNSVKNDSVGRGWFGDFISKLSFRPKNQMILPDDKNPSIVWNAEQKKWVNLNEKEETPVTHAPPKDLEIPSPILYSVNDSRQTFDSPTINKFKLQKGRGSRQNYVDILNPSVSQNAPNSRDFPI